MARRRCRGRRATGLTALLATALLAIAGCGTGPGTPRAAPTPASPPVHVMIVGDSLTHESAGDYTWRYRLWQHLDTTAHGRVDFVGDRDDIWDNVADKGGSHDYAVPDFDNDHHALWGDSLRNETPKIADVVRAHPADLMLIALGANDLSYYTLPADTATVVRTFIANVRSVNPSMTFVIGHVLARADLRDNTMNLPGAPVYDAILDQQATSWSTPASRVVVARTDTGWDPLVDAWDGSHPTPDGEMIIARGFADALASLGIGSPFEKLPAHIPWPGQGHAPTVTPAGTGANQATLTWAPTPGATQYVVERKVVSWGEQGFTRQGDGVPGYTWTSDPLLTGVTVAYRVVPWKGRMPGIASPPTIYTVGGLASYHLP